MKQTPTSYDNLPHVLNATQLAQTLGISRAGAYNLMNSKGFPTLRIGSRKLVPKEHLTRWIEQQVQNGGDTYV